MAAAGRGLIPGSSSGAGPPAAAMKLPAIMAVMSGPEAQCELGSRHQSGMSRHQAGALLPPSACLYVVPKSMPIAGADIVKDWTGDGAPG